MAAGKRAFDRPESVQTMSAIIGEEAPPIEQSIPAPLRWVIERCLAKIRATATNRRAICSRICAACAITRRIAAWRGRRLRSLRVQLPA